MAGRPRTKNGKSYVFYLSDEADILIEQYKGKLSRSNFVEEAIKYYASHLADNPKEEDGQQKNYNKREDNPNQAGVAEPGQRRWTQDPLP